MKLYEIIEKSANAALKLQSPDGSMKAGHNGPYFDEETPVRTTGHWLITFLKAYEITKDKKYLDGAYNAVLYLLSENARPMKATFWHRKNPKKDFSNGLVGQAWSIEALSVAAAYFDIPDIKKIAEEVFLIHPFDEASGLWRRIGVDGSFLSKDETFNHQLWFAAAGGLLEKVGKNHEVGRRISIFMNNILRNLGLYPAGLIVHDLRQHNMRQMLKRLLLLFESSQRKALINKAIGYHQFNLYAFALLKQCYPRHSFWQSKKFKTLWKYATTYEYRKKLGESDFGYPYNPPGFEMAFALEVFGEAMPDKREKQESWLTEQMRLCFDFNVCLMTRGTKDPETQSARIYEATRLPNLNVTI